MSNEIEESISDIRESIDAVYDELLGTIDDPGGILADHNVNTKFIAEYGEAIKDVVKWHKERKSTEKAIKIKFWIAVMLALLSFFMARFWDGVKSIFQ